MIRAEFQCPLPVPALRWEPATCHGYTHQQVRNGPWPRDTCWRQRTGHLSPCLFPPLPRVDWSFQNLSLAAHQESPLPSLSESSALALVFISIPPFLSPSHPGSEMSPFPSFAVSEHSNCDEWDHLLSLYCILTPGLSDLWLLSHLSGKQLWPHACVPNLVPASSHLLDGMGPPWKAPWPNSSAHNPLCMSFGQLPSPLPRWEGLCLPRPASMICSQGPNTPFTPPGGPAGPFQWGVARLSRISHA